ncbi:hypothetical protein PPACK8108_LOCUS19584 [Phakopsora pachyrhizi]|uniref:WW domain-containing protein n=1 Tax=Phakopsora pachyrhizi TaxID=170000 RepID=A0AAV0BD89_PHAPC|nr:hypothetical protein PPACK8108_LOCUS19584 [Phakopsora pachyrhizi]
MNLFDKRKSDLPPYSPSNNQIANSGSDSLNPYPPLQNHQQQQQQQQSQFNNYSSSSSNNNNSNSSDLNPGNSDQRPLPPGWEKQWDERYQRYFYIDTKAPAGPQSHWTHPSDLQIQNEPQRYNNQRTQPVPQNQPYYNVQQPNYQQQQPVYQQANPVSNNQRARPGMNPLLAGAGGLAGGMLLGSMLGGHHSHHGYDSGYMNGYEDGYENGEFNDSGGFDGGFDGGFF